MEKYKARFLAQGPDGAFQSLVSGAENEREIKTIIFRLVHEFQHRQKCPADKVHPDCPFRMLSGLSYTSVRSLVDSMPLKDCLHLFDIELACRTGQLASQQPVCEV